MINKNKYVYIQVKISKEEYAVYKRIVENHNRKGIRHDYFQNFDKISMSKLGLASLRMFTKKMLNSEDWDIYPVYQQ